MTEFESWLSGKLKALNMDESVFQPYIISILEGEEESEEEKREGITGLLADALDNEDDIETAFSDIVEHYAKMSSSDNTETVTQQVDNLNITEKMHAITQQQIANSLIRKVEKTDEEKRIKEAILNGFAVEGGDDSDEDSGDGGDGLGPANTNAENVQKEALEMREKQAAAAAAKKEKDKQDRANQKNQAEERKKKAQEKAAKGERKSGR